MFSVSQDFIPMGICLLLLVIFIIYRICVLNNQKPFFPIIALILILACVPYSSVYESKPVDGGTIAIGDLPINVTSNGFYMIYEKKENGLIITHKLPCDKVSLVVDDTHPSTLFKSSVESNFTRISFLFNYVGFSTPAPAGSESYNLSIHGSQLPAGFIIQKPLEQTPPKNSAPASETVTPEQ